MARVGRMITVAGLTPSVDLTYVVEHLELGRIHRPEMTQQDFAPVIGAGALRGGRCGLGLRRRGRLDVEHDMIKKPGLPFAHYCVLAYG